MVTATSRVYAQYQTGGEERICGLSAGAQSVDWWSLNDTANAGASCVNPGSGLFNAAGRPYYGYQLAQPCAQLKSYSAGSQNAPSSKIDTGTTPALSVASRIDLPPESVTVLETQ
jgi:hypothetical protein